MNIYGEVNEDLFYSIANVQTYSVSQYQEEPWPSEYYKGVLMTCNMDRKNNVAWCLYTTTPTPFTYMTSINLATGNLTSEYQFGSTWYATGALQGEDGVGFFYRYPSPGYVGYYEVKTGSYLWYVSTPNGGTVFGLDESAGSGGDARMWTTNSSGHLITKKMSDGSTIYHTRVPGYGYYGMLMHNCAIGYSSTLHNLLYLEDYP